ncbi:phage virion morphogenesis protein [Edwardsiella anguillarum]|uniref:phage virion morphogenesis protein n=1 Tax=Edwardsiella anguillarum TaxID=1821960 RepID=UPI0024B7F3FE|nr:phage virion morphogenesis protein [Edwardsiella anguillarum]WHQ13384.1 phage virion morphogenesis protein [Edwardsiella anguillarum]
MNDDLLQLHRWADGLLAKLSPASRTQLARDIARSLRQSQSQRITAQKNPDGSAFIQRKKQQQKGGGQITFLYQKVGDSVEERTLTAWRGGTKLLIGYDPLRKNIRSFRKDRIVRYLRRDTNEIKRPLRLRNKVMFRKLRTTRYMKGKGDGQGATISFVNSVRHMAAVHQYGLRDRVNRYGLEVDYPQRQLLGFSAEDVRKIEDLVINHLQS